MAATIQAARFDVLYYWEVGTDDTNYFLPYLRLAPVQCTSWGIQITSGIPTVDYYISSALVEPDDAADHYSEELLLARTLLSYQQRVELGESPKRREDFGIRAERHLYLCAESAKVSSRLRPNVGRNSAARPSRGGRAYRGPSSSGRCQSVARPVCSFDERRVRADRVFAVAIDFRLFESDGRGRRVARPTPFRRRQFELRRVFARQADRHLAITVPARAVHAGLLQEDGGDGLRGVKRRRIHRHRRAARNRRALAQRDRSQNSPGQRRSCSKIPKRSANTIASLANW